MENAACVQLEGMAVKIIPLSRDSEDPKRKIWLLDIQEKAAIYINSLYIVLPQSQCDILLTRYSVRVHASILV